METSGATPMELFDWFTSPSKLTQWWCEAVPQFEHHVGGEYHLQWVEADYHLNGIVTAYDPPRHLAFTWRFAHEPDLPTRNVTIDFLYTSDGTEVILTHSEYDDSEADQQDRQNHIDGWTHFLGVLGELAARPPTSP